MGTQMNANALRNKKFKQDNMFVGINLMSPECDLVTCSKVSQKTGCWKSIFLTEIWKTSFNNLINLAQC